MCETILGIQLKTGKQKHLVPDSIALAVGPAPTCSLAHSSCHF